MKLFFFGLFFSLLALPAFASGSYGVGGASGQPGSSGWFLLDGTEIEAGESGGPFGVDRSFEIYGAGGYGYGFPGGSGGRIQGTLPAGWSFYVEDLSVNAQVGIFNPGITDSYSLTAFAGSDGDVLDAAGGGTELGSYLFATGFTGNPGGYTVPEPSGSVSILTALLAGVGFNDRLGAAFSRLGTVVVLAVGAFFAFLVIKSGLGWAHRGLDADDARVDARYSSAGVERRSMAAAHGDLLDAENRLDESEAAFL